MVTRANLSAKIAEVHGISKKAADEIIVSVFSMITEEMAAGEKVSIHGFGSFERKERAARKGRNPQTGAEIEIAARMAPNFKASTALKDALQK